MTHTQHAFRGRRAVGMNEIADRVRPSKRNPGRTLANNEGDAPEAPADPTKPS
jgi:hypothetical protein